MQEQAIGVYPHPQRADQVIVDPARHLPLDLKFSVLVGEICYNLRAALDYLVYELARLDSGSTQDDTQFIIADSPSKFEEQRPRRLIGFSTAHAAAIERLQPYSGCKWTGALRDISNPDKHRKLTTTQAEHVMTVHVVDKDHLRDFEDLPGKIRSVETADGEVYVKIFLTTDLQFSDGSPVLEPLAQIHDEVARALDTFSPDFSDTSATT
jgi:hypothetical protein